MNTPRAIAALLVTSAISSTAFAATSWEGTYQMRYSDLHATVTCVLEGQTVTGRLDIALDQDASMSQAQVDALTASMYRAIEARRLSPRREQAAFRRADLAVDAVDQAVTSLVSAMPYEMAVDYKGGASRGAQPIKLVLEGESETQNAGAQTYSLVSAGTLDVNTAAFQVMLMGVPSLSVSSEAIDEVSASFQVGADLDAARGELVSAIGLTGAGQGGGGWSCRIDARSAFVPVMR